MSHVDLSRIPDFYHRYVHRVSADDLPTALAKHVTNFIPLLQSLPEEKWSYAYASGKWTIKELVQHVIDAERILACRALRFARKDQTPLPGFDEDHYALHSKANNRKPADLLKELELVQQSTTAMFNSFDDEQLNQTGEGNGKSFYVKGLAYIIMGHAMHHRGVMEERYL